LGDFYDHQISVDGIGRPCAGCSTRCSKRCPSESKSNKLAGFQGASIAPIVIGIGILAGVTYLIIDHENDDDNSDSN
jgi:coenzyme F420-reducing hydrogenase gamma subunit